MLPPFYCVLIYQGRVWQPKEEAPASGSSAEPTEHRRGIDGAYTGHRRGIGLLTRRRAHPAGNPGRAGPKRERESKGPKATTNQTERGMWRYRRSAPHPHGGTPPLIRPMRHVFGWPAGRIPCFDQIWFCTCENNCSYTYRRAFFHGKNKWQWRAGPWGVFVSRTNHLKHPHITNTRKLGRALVVLGPSTGITQL